MPRDIKNPGIFAADALTDIPTNPVVGASYRNAATGLDAIRAGWPFNRIVSSADFAQILHQLTSLTDLVDRVGILPHSESVGYTFVPAFVQGSDGLVYKSTVANGLDNAGDPVGPGVVDPVGDDTGVWEEFSSGGGATGGGSDEVFHLNSHTITSSFTIPDGQNAGSFGPITINDTDANGDDIVITIPDGSAWSIT